MHIFRRRAAREAELRRQAELDQQLDAVPAASRPLDPAIRNMLRAVATGVVDGSVQARASMLDVDATGAEAVVLLRQEAGLSVGDLAERLERSHSATVRVVERLVEAGLARKSRSAQDARRAKVELTPRGKDQAEVAAAAADEVVDDVLADLTSGERVLLRRVLGKVAARLPGGAAQGSRVCRHCDPRECGVEACPRERLL